MIRDHRFKFNKYVLHKNRDSSIKEKVNKIGNHTKIEDNLEELIQNIDNQINQAFNKQNIKKVPSLHLHYLKSIRQQHNQTFTNAKHETPIVKQYKSSIKEDKGITLINNKDVMKYVKHIYSYYNIPDPEFKNRDNSMRKNINFSSTNKKIGNYMEETIDTSRTINSARTIRQNDRQIEKINVSPFLYQQTNQNMRTHRKVITLKPKIKTTKQQIISFSNSKSVGKYEIDNHNLSKTANINLSSTKERINQTFRYCFMCQQPILDHNLQFHEEQCHELKRAYTFTLKQLMNILDNKIFTFTQQIKSNFLILNNEQILKEHLQHKEILQQWLNQIEYTFQQDSLQDIFKVQENTYINRIDNDILKKNVYKLEVINKLHWFLKLKKNIKMKYYNQK